MDISRTPNLPTEFEIDPGRAADLNQPLRHCGDLFSGQSDQFGMRLGQFLFFNAVRSGVVV